MLKWLTVFTAIVSLNAYSQSTDYSVAGVEYEGFYLSAGENTPLVIMVHDWDGLTQYEKTRAAMLQEQGYSVFAVDLYGKGVRPESVEDKRAQTSALYQDREKMRDLMSASISHASSLGGNRDNAAVVGYCFGGSVTLEMARAGIPMKSFVSFHGGLATPDDQSYKDTKGEVFVFHGTADKVVPMSDFASLAEQLETAGVEHEMATYSGAPHAFTVLGSSKYHEKADKKSWQRFSEYLKETF
ncbi:MULTISPECIES: dienelactone hydrolase family protein [unclassified Neptuniibacter]|uniref:dienelactone hydrolase family protein n=1 Tax=unclassified Neptuniibacter TaxID=2630693 RepID=UPI000C3F30D3|nr:MULTISPECIES: dienelactone hydrolase family protein [unclassified Neptuniibacter]MAY41948.1 dienelactone hydrolase [Oceanospirillaceae bacterium]|tara:strand:- start:18359 stop:19084 length:726 start_codon:yes stop_codon:yes gene_type:complete